MPELLMVSGESATLVHNLSVVQSGEFSGRNINCSEMEPKIDWKENYSLIERLNCEKSLGLQASTWPYKDIVKMIQILLIFPKLLKSPLKKNKLIAMVQNVKLIELRKWLMAPHNWG